MATESSSVLVAVRVRPFSAREDTACCTVTVPDSTTISVLDVPALMPSAAAASGPGAGDATTGNGGGGFDSGNFLFTATVVGGGGGGAKNTSSISPNAVDTLRHSYSFDKIFWSVAPSVLPFPPPAMLDVLNSGEGDKLSQVRVPGLVLPTPAQRALLSQNAAVAQYLPCFATPPTYDDQKRVYDFIGPRMHDAIMSGFNACLFAYGQTGSGKSYSMIGPTEAISAAVASAKGAAAAASVKATTISTVSSGSPITEDAERGIMPRLFTDLFRRMREEREEDESVSFTTEVSFFEIYCEKVRDLLAVTSTSMASNANYFSAFSSTGGSLRIRQHPSQGPYVEGLTHVKVRDEESVLKHLLNGLRDRATAGTNMNEHSSRSHAILQLHVTKVVLDTDEGTGAVVTRTCMCKATMVDLAGSERVSQSGVSGERFEEAKNINLSLSTLGRVIQQLSEKQSGKHVIPSYRDSVLTWLLSDSLGGNSKTIMLATVAPSAYCYQQTLNTLRFAGVAKKVVNVATVNEDRHFEQLIAELRQQIVRLTLQLESGKAAEVHLEKIEALKREKEELLSENDTLKARVVAAADTTVLQALRKRVKELERENAQLREEVQSLQERLLSSTATLREELAQQRAEVIRLHEALSKKEAEARESTNRYRALVLSTTSPVVAATTSSSAAGGVNRLSGRAAPNTNASAGAPSSGTAAAAGVEGGQAMVSASEAQRIQQRLQEEVNQLKSKLAKSSQESAAAQRARQEVADGNKKLTATLDEYKVRYEECTRQLNLLHERMQSTTSLLETTQCELTAIKARNTHEPVTSRAVEYAPEAVNTASTVATAQLDQMRSDYLGEKERNVELLLRVAHIEQERSSLKRTLAAQAADTCELEQLLLEETESAERYYLRMRYHRYTNELTQRFLAQLQRLQQQLPDCRRARRTSDASAERFVPLSSAFGGSVQRPHHGESDDEREGMEEGGASTGADTASSHRGDDGAEQTKAKASERSAASTAEEKAARLLLTQLLFVCQSEEAQGRAAVEVECLYDAVRLASQHGRFRQLAIAALAERLGEAEDAQRALREELAFFKQKVRAAETEYEEEVSRHQADTAALQVAEKDRLRLGRKVAELESVNEELEGGRDSLIAKVAFLQEQQSSWRARCAEAERIAAEVQDLLLPGSAGVPHNGASNTAGNTRSGWHNEKDAKQQQQQQPDTSAAFQLDRAALASRARAAQDALDAKAALEQQCETYRTELGGLRAQLEQLKSERQDAVSRLARHDQDLQLAESRHAESNDQLLHEISTITRDYESRIKQQQTMMRTLRHALEEETAAADLCRQSAQRAEASRQSQEDELIAARESCEEHRRQEELLSTRHLEVQAELDQLRLQYNALERQLMGLRETEPELYLLLEKGLEDNTTDWLDKVRKEKLCLQKQRSEAQRLNTELLEHVRDGNTRLRDVQQQLTDVSFGETSPQDHSPVARSPQSEMEEEELTKKTSRKRSHRRYSQLE